MLRKKPGVELKVDAGAGAAGNVDAGKLFNAGGNNDANDEAIGKAADAVSKVSGKQILHAIVTSGDGGGAKASAAKNPIDAAIGADGNDNNAFGVNMQKNDAIAAALVLRGMAKGGKFALDGGANGQKSLKNAVESAVTGTSEWLKEMIDAAKKAGEKNGGAGESIGNVATADSNGAQGNADSVKAIAGGMKGIVDAAKKAGVELKVGGDAGGGGAGNENVDAGKLFNVGGRAGANDEAIGKAADAVSKVSGKQILHAIVTSDGNGAGASTATNPIDSAIGAADDDNAAFGAGNMQKNDAIAAALVLRGMAKDGKFALANAAKGTSLKNAVESAVTGTSEWLKEMIDAAKKAGEKSGGGVDSIGNVAAANSNGAKGDAGSVKAIAGGMKGIVDAAKKAGVELKVDGGGGAAENADVGKLFNVGGRASANDAAIGKAADAVSKVSGKQILHAIVTSGGDGNGAGASTATNPIDAAIGAAGDDANAFGDNMQKNDAIAAALVLRGMAKGGKFALDGAAANGQKSLKNAVESAVTGTSGWLKEMIDAAKKAGEKNGGGGVESTGNVAAAGNNGAQGDADGVKAIAGGMKGIVDAAKKAGVELKVDAGGGNENEDVGKLFNAGGRDNADDAAIGKAADAVSKVSGKQILHAIVTSGDGNGARASDATNPIDAAIGAAENDAAGAFTGNMQKNDAIATALVLRGMAKDGKFALAAGANGQKSLKNAVESAVTGTSGWLKEMIDAAKKAGEKSGGGGVESIGNVATAGNNGAKGDAGSVKAIAGGMKRIVDAAKKAGVELKVDAGDGGDGGNANAGKLFNVGGHDNADDAAIGKAADAVSKVSGKQILHAIVTSGDGNGAKASTATNPIDAAIGGDGNDNNAFGDNMRKNDAIAAALVLRGMAKGGKFALANAANGQKSLKNAVESAVTGTSGWLKEMIDAAKKAGEKSGGGGGESIGNVADADSNGAQGNADSVKAIAGGMKGIVDAAKKARCGIES
ncbi:variable large family protein (plasmid) [Borreliella americana]|uniref:Variable large family protein n=1 Tax=Borreliella americana TaxID=478807 RepID=A0ACD5G5W6_9SPIR